MKSQRFIRESVEPKKQILWLSIFVAAFFFILLSRLWYLQIIKAENYHDLSESNRLRLVPVAASRGTIFDRTGKVIVSNRPSFSVAVIPQEVKDKELLLDKLAKYLNVDRSELEERWVKGGKRAKYVPIILASGVSREQVEILEENRLRLPGLDIEMKPVREYPNGQLAAHLLGYIGEISEQELGKDDYKGYNPGDYLGKSGIERSWERTLHGADGGRQIEVDARGRVLRTVNETIPKLGNSMVLTIDMDLQKQTELAFGEQAGAAVAMDVNTGEILAFVSNPGFDPALFAGKMPAKQWSEYLEDKRHPLENKALKGQYPPGSTFKIITALAGLEEGLINQNTSVNCKGSHTLGSSTFKCWEKRGHGTVNLKRALKESCDVYFYQLGERLGVDKIAAYSKKFNLGEPTGIGLENEKAGLIPTTDWKLKKYNKKWFHGETLPVAIGQGYVLMTPIQLASMIAAVSNGGSVYKPHLVKKIIDQDGKVLQEFSPQLQTSIGISQRSLDLVKEGLLAVVNEPGGTGGRSRLYEVKVAGKTGTSQVVKLRDGKGRNQYQYRDHALFVAFAPFEKPEIAVGVVVEHGEHGGAAAAPIAGRIFQTYFTKKGVIGKPVREENASSAGADREVLTRQE